MPAPDGSPRSYAVVVTGGACAGKLSGSGYVGWAAPTDWLAPGVELDASVATASAVTLQSIRICCSVVLCCAGLRLSLLVL